VFIAPFEELAAEALRGCAYRIRVIGFGREREVGGGEVSTLNLGSHRAVEDEDAFGKGFQDRVSHTADYGESGCGTHGEAGNRATGKFADGNPAAGKGADGIHALSSRNTRILGETTIS